MARELGRIMGVARCRESRVVFSRDALALLADGVRWIAGGARYRKSRGVISRTKRWALLAGGGNGSRVAPGIARAVVISRAPSVRRCQPAGAMDRGWRQV